MYRIVIFSFCAIHFSWGQSINSPPLDWIQTDGTGAYRFGYATGDKGRHYHVSSATADNTVAGRFGYKHPGTGEDLRTTYTAGRRGFRARGPHIARRMDLSQNKPPFSRPNNDGQYHPELDNIPDPTEDRGYDFSYRTPNHIKEEHANRFGDVQGRYSYLDDIGFRHNVEYIAGSKTGFVVTNPVPDTFAQARGGPLYYVGKTGGSKVRGFSAVQKNLNGAYRFLASGPDHKRSEISDAAGNRRGVYTYLDDKGVQHTVEYIAGPKIGYKVINNKKGVNYNPILPYFPDSSTIQPLFPAASGESATNKPLRPFPTVPFPPSSSTGSDLFSPASGGDFPSLSGGVNTGIGGGVGSSGGSGLGGNENGGLPSFRPPPAPTGPSKPSSNRPSSLGESPSGRPPSLFKPSSSKPPSLDNSSNNGPSFSFEQPGNFPPIAPVFPSPSPFPIPARPPSPPDFDNTDQKWNYDFDYFFNDPSTANKDWSKPIKGQSNKNKGGVSSTPVIPTFDSFPDIIPSPFPEPAFLLPNPFDEGLNTAESGNGLKPPYGGQDKNNCNHTTNFNQGGGSNNNENDNKDGHRGDGNSYPGFGSSSSSNSGTSSGSGSGSSSGSGSGLNSSSGSGSSSSSGSSSGSGSGTKGTNDQGKHYYKGQKALHYPSRGTVKFGGVKKSEWHKKTDEDGFFAIPPGVAVRAHVQSLDIVPYDKRFVSPGEALKHLDDKKHPD